jgi:hypothetical protein
MLEPSKITEVPENSNLDEDKLALGKFKNSGTAFNLVMALNILII